MHKMQLSLFANAIDFIEKGIEEFVAAERDGKTREYKYAILHIAQGVELILKHILSKEHQLFIYNDIDSIKHENTVSVEKAIIRINRLHTDSKITDEQQKILKNIRDKRNELTHNKADVTKQHATSIITQTFPIIDYLLRRYLDTTLKVELLDDIWTSLVKIERFHREYYNDLRSKHIFIEYAGNRLTCYHCQMQTITQENSIIECVYCRSTFESEEKIIRLLEQSEMKRAIVKAYISEQDIQTCICTNCNQNSVIFSKSARKVICLHCNSRWNRDLIYCECCDELAGVEILKYKDDVEKATCLNCKVVTDPGVCDQCGITQYNLKFVYNLNKELCDYCLHFYEKALRD